MFTLNDVLEYCNECISIYQDLSEDAGMSGDIETSEMLEKEAKELEKMVLNIKEDLDVNQQISIGQYKIWLNSPKNKEVRKIITAAIETIKNRKIYEKDKLEKDIDFCKSLNEGCLYDN